MNVCSLCGFEPCSHTFLIPIYFFSIKNSQSSLVLPSFITKLKHPNTARMWIVFCSWLIVFHSIIESEHTFILKTTMLMSLFSFMGLFSLWHGMWNKQICWCLLLISCIWHNKPSSLNAYQFQFKSNKSWYQSGNNWMKEHRDTQVPSNRNQGFTSSLFNCYSQPKASTLPWKVSQESYHCGTCTWILGWWACSSCCFHEVCIQKQFVSCETTILKCLGFQNNPK